MVRIAGFDIGPGVDEGYYEKTENVEKYDEIRRDSAGGQQIWERERRWVEEFFSSQGTVAWHDEPPLDGVTVLDCAGGTGELSSYLDSLGAEVTYLDRSNEMVGAARGRSRESQEIQYIRGDAAGLPFEEDAFDYAVSLRTAHVIPEEDMPAYVSELGRVAEDGVLFDTFSTPSLRSVYNPLLPMDSTLYTDTEIERYIKDCDSLTVDETSNEFVVPYAAYLVVGNSIGVDQGVGLVDAVNRALESFDVTDPVSSVTVWQLATGSEA